MSFATADLLDDHPDAQVCAPGWKHYGTVTAIAGPAQTVHAPEDNTFVRATLETPGEGRVLVVDGGGSAACALLGDNLATLAVDNGWAGVVIDGYLRDSAVIDQMPLGVWALGSMPRKSDKQERGKVGGSVEIRGIAVTPGAWIYADGDGVVVASNRLH